MKFCKVTLLLPNEIKNVFGRCPLLGQLFFIVIFTVYSITVSVALLSAAVVAAAAGCPFFQLLRCSLLLPLQWAAKLLLFAAGCSSCSATKGCYKLLQCCCKCCCHCCYWGTWAGQQSVVPFCPRPGWNSRLDQPTTVPARQDLFHQAQPGQCGSILEHSVGANPQFGQGSSADRPHTSRLSLSANCSVTAPCYRSRQVYD